MRPWLFLGGILLVMGVVSLLNRETAMPQNEKPIRQRHEMVERQIIARGVRDEEVLRAMRKVPRHLFVPESFRRLAYADEPLPIGEDQTISQPYIVAYMTEALRLKGGERVLEIGTGSGYQAAVLAEIADSVFTIEIVPALADRAAETLADLGYDNVRCLKGDGTYGWPEKAPFDAIMVTAAPPSIPSALSEQLKEGGRMIIPVGTWYQELILVTRKNGALRKERLIPVRFVPMTGDSRKKE